jgi:DNA-binding NarL/FixJ family response regulator
MTKPNIQIDNLVREMTDEEYQTYLLVTADQAEQEAKEQAKIKTRESAIAKLTKLGLTANEIEALQS